MLRSDHLYYFYIVSQTSSLNQAAQLLHLTPSALSHALKKLEKELNLTLFTRTSKGIVLTEDGNAIAAMTAPIISSIERLEKYAQALSIKYSDSKLPPPPYLTLFSENGIFESQLSKITNTLYTMWPTLDFIIAEKPITHVLTELSNDPYCFSLLMIGSDKIEEISQTHPNIGIITIQQYPVVLYTKVNSKFIPAAYKQGVPPSSA